MPQIVSAGRAFKTYINTLKNLHNKIGRMVQKEDFNRQVQTQAENYRAKDKLSDMKKYIGWV